MRWHTESHRPVFVLSVQSLAPFQVKEQISFLLWCSPASFYWIQTTSTAWEDNLSLTPTHSVPPQCAGSYWLLLLLLLQVFLFPFGFSWWLATSLEAQYHQQVFWWSPGWLCRWTLKFNCDLLRTGNARVKLALLIAYDVTYKLCDGITANCRPDTT